MSLTKSGGNPQLSTLYHDIISQSSLAKAIALLYNGISSSRIAHLSLTPSLSLSFQIPVPRSISSLPTPLMRQKPGMWLTTATTLPADDDIPLSNVPLGSHFALLLLSDTSTIIADVNAAKSPIAGPLIQYLGANTPTKSFSQISQSSGISLSDIQFLASHLIYWRRAQAIPPLHQRDTYIVSPNANMASLTSAMSSFAKAFPALPSLSQILQMLSISPRPYSSIIPSKDHKPAYMDILAWLLRDGWVTQLRSFVWVLIPAHIKAAVDREIFRDNEREKEKATLQESKLQSAAAAAASSKFPQSPNTTSSTKLGISDLVATSPTSSTGTAIPILDSWTLGHPYPNSNSTSSTASTTELIIHNPRLASAIHSRYLLAVSAYVGREQSPDTRVAWDKCVVYFDGKHAVENIAVSEGWKRKFVDELMVGWEDLGIVIRAKHW